MCHNVKLDFDKVLKIMSDKDISHITLCKDIGISTSEFRLISKGKRNAKMSTISKISIGLDVDIRELLIWF
jgi:DNA-binding Xre family transcriptional regulator